jgi:hypothetical protein
VLPARSSSAWIGSLDEVTGGNAQQRPAIEPGDEQLPPPAAAPPTGAEQRTAVNPTEESR